MSLVRKSDGQGGTKNVYWQSVPKALVRSEDQAKWQGFHDANRVVTPKFLSRRESSAETAVEPVDYGTSPRRSRTGPFKVLFFILWPILTVGFVASGGSFASGAFLGLISALFVSVALAIIGALIRVVFRFIFSRAFLGLIGLIVFSFIAFLAVYRYTQGVFPDSKWFEDAIISVQNIAR